MRQKKSSAGSLTYDHIDAGSLSNLESVLNGVEGGTRALRWRWEQVTKAVRSGAYQVDPLQLSRRIINDLLSP